jgi:hypothetical protein
MVSVCVTASSGPKGRYALSGLRRLDKPRDTQHRLLLVRSAHVPPASVLTSDGHRKMCLGVT